MQDGLNEINRYRQRYAALKNERSSWDAHWMDLSSYLMPRAGRFQVQNRNNGQRKYNKVYDSTGIRASKVLSAGLMAGMTSPARPWFRLSTSDPQLDATASVKVWLAETTRLMLMIFSRSNTYRALHSLYGELGVFGTAASIVEPSFQKVVHHHSQTIGQYLIATNSEGIVNTIYRELDMTVAQLVKEFGLENCSHTVRNLFNSNTLDAWVPVCQLIEPRLARDPRKADPRNMAWKSVYFETGDGNGKVLRESGFKAFRAVVPRWELFGGDIYGSSPGMEALGDIRQLQHEQLRKAEGIDYQTKPPLQVPASLKNSPIERLPGGVTYADMTNQQSGIRSLFEVNLDLNHLLADIQDVRERIKSAFYMDLFLMLANDTRSGITATEVAERHEEKMLMLGPVLERLHNELLDPLIEITFTQMIEAGIVPPPPPELQGAELNVEFVSMLAQAQRAVATSSVDRFVMNLGSIAQLKPDVLDKFDSDKWADSYSDMLGVDPDLIVPGQQVALIRKQRAQAQAQQQQMAAMEQSANTAKNLAAAKTNEPNALNNVMNLFSGYGT